MENFIKSFISIFSIMVLYGGPIYANSGDLDSKHAQAAAKNAREMFAKAGLGTYSESGAAQGAILRDRVAAGDTGSIKGKSVMGFDPATGAMKKISPAATPYGDLNDPSKRADFIGKEGQFVRDPVTKKWVPAGNSAAKSASAIGQSVKKFGAISSCSTGLKKRAVQHLLTVVNMVTEKDGITLFDLGNGKSFYGAAYATNADGWSVIKIVNNGKVMAISIDAVTQGYLKDMGII